MHHPGDTLDTLPAQIRHIYLTERPKTSRRPHPPPTPPPSRPVEGVHAVVLGQRHRHVGLDLVPVVGIGLTVHEEREHELVAVARGAVADEVRDVVQRARLADAVALGGCSPHLVLERAGLATDGERVGEVCVSGHALQYGDHLPGRGEV